MEEQAINLLDKSILPANETAITMGDKMLMIDSLSSPLAHPEAQSASGRFPMKLSMPHLLLVESGEVRLNVNFRDSVVKAGCCALIGANAMLERVAVSDDARVILMLFSCSMTTMLQQDQPVVTWKLHVEHMTMLKLVYGMMRTIMLNNAFAPNREDNIVSCLNLMGSIIGQAGDSNPDIKPSRQDEIVARFLQCVHDNYREHRDLGFYAAQLGLTLKYMSHVIYGQTGRHPSQWIKDYVILEAKSMLRSGRYSIQQIADELHFPNQSFFGKYFKEAVGVSPKKWK
jgi:AraC-like DNA-binding protein